MTEIVKEFPRRMGFGCNPSRWRVPGDRPSLGFADLGVGPGSVRGTSHKADANYQTASSRDLTVRMSSGRNGAIADWGTVTTSMKFRRLAFTPCRLNSGWLRAKPRLTLACQRQ